MTDKEELAVFDFCDTLVFGQTADEFLLRILARYPLRKIQFYLLYGSRLKRNKKALLYRLCDGIPAHHVETVASEYATLLRSRLVATTNKILNARESSNVVIVSAGFSNYISRIYPNCKVIANNLQCRNGLVSAKDCLVDCFGEEKVVRLSETFNLSRYSVSVFSDCPSDLPLFKIGRGYLVAGDDIFELRAVSDEDL